MRKRMKTISILLCICLLLLSGCGSKDTKSENEDSDDSSSGVKIENVKEGDNAGVGEEYPMKETVIADTEEFKFTVKRVTTDNYGNINVETICENKTDKPATFQWFHTYVNGYEVNAFWQDQTAAGETKESIAIFPKEDLTRCGIETPDEITFDLYFDNGASDTESQVYNIYPTNLSADQVKYPDVPVNKDSATLLDNDLFKVILVGPEVNSAGNTCLNLYIENKCSENLYFFLEDGRINGTDVGELSLGGGFAEELPGGKRKVYNIFNNDVLSTVKDMSSLTEFSCQLVPAENWGNPDTFTEETLSYTK